MNKAQLQKMSREMSWANHRSHNKPDRWDRIRMHLVEGRKLKKADQKMLDRAYQIWPLLCSGRTTKEIVDILLKVDGIDSERVARRAITDTKRIFGDAQAYNKEAEKAILIEMVKQAYRKAAQLDKPRDMVTASKLLAELMGLEQDQNHLKEVYESLQLPPVVYSSDPEILNQETTYVEIEELPVSA